MDASSNWINAAERQPAHDRKVLALSPRENLGYTDVGYKGKPCAIITARWEVQLKRWKALVGTGWTDATVIWWREVPPLPEGVFSIPPDRD
jgi:hypothetical protein